MCNFYNSNHWKRALKMIFKGTVCFQFPEAVILLQRKKPYALPNAVHYKFSLFYRSSNCREHLINFSSEGKPTL